MNPKTFRAGNRPVLRAGPAAFLLLFALGFSAVRADIQLPPKGGSRGERQLQKRVPLPPSPVATKVRVQPGGTADIVLQANGAPGKPIGFLLRTAPAHGAFAGTPRRIGRDSVEVTYIHRAADGPGHDSFTFATQAPGTAVSAAETVDIEIVEAAPDAVPAGAPDLAARPAELDFGAVESGNSSGLTLTVENRGAGLADGWLEPPPPWVVDGDAAYRLGKGGQQTFRLVFKPHGEGAFAETLRVDAGIGGSTSGCVVRLVGIGLPAAARETLTLPSPPAATALLPVAAQALPPPAPPAAPTPDRPASSAQAAPVVASLGTALTNEAQVKAVKVVAIGSSTVELSWKQPVPLPRSYRVERRTFARDERAEGGVRVDWLPYDRTDFRVRGDEVTARLRGLSPDEWETLRVVSVDTAGQLSRPSPPVNLVTLRGTEWWRPTLLKGLFLALAVCVGLIVRRRWQERQLLRELDSRHVDGDPSTVERTGSFRSSL